MPKMKITEAFITKINGTGKLVFYFDTELKGFGIYVTPKNVKSYFVKGRVNGKQVKTAISPCNVMKLKDARLEAQKILSGMKHGVNPQQEKREKKLAGISLGEVFDEYLKERKSLKPGTVVTYRKLLNYHLSDWLSKPITEITPDMVSARHDKITKLSGKAPANNVMRTLRAIYNYARVITENKIPDNPVKRLTAAKSWHKIARRDTLITTYELPKWYDAVIHVEDSGQRDYLLLLLFTGLRREEAAQLKWDDVDLSARTLKVIDTKNGKPHVLPLPNYLLKLFEDRKHIQTGESSYVFPGQGKRGYISKPNRAIRKITEKTGIDFCLHDLRRTFSTIAENIVSYAELKRLLNHSTENDVTQGYLIISTEKLRAPMERISKTILEYAKPEVAMSKILNISDYLNPST